MPRVHVVIALSQVLLSVACSSSTLTNTGAGGTGGGVVTGDGGAPATGGVGGPGSTGGSAGTGGIGGSAGTGSGGIAGAGGFAGYPVNDPAGHSGAPGGMGGIDGSLPQCTSGPAGNASGGAGGNAAGGAAGSAGSPATVESCVYDMDAKPLLTSVTATVTVASIDQVPDGNCGFFYLPYLTKSSTPSTKLVLESATQQRWTVYLRIPNLPADTFRVGDTFDLAISAQTVFWQGAEQMISLARNGKLVAFGYTGYEVRQNDFDTYGIKFTDGGPVCSVFGCGFIHSAVHVTSGTAATDVVEGQTALVGGLSFTLSQDVEWHTTGSCDASNHVVMGGFIASPP